MEYTWYDGFKLRVAPRSVNGAGRNPRSFGGRSIPAGGTPFQRMDSPQYTIYAKCSFKKSKICRQLSLFMTTPL